MLEVPEYFNFAADVIEKWASERRDALGLWWVNQSGDTERKFTFQELATQARQSAHLFDAAGIKRGDRVLIVLPRIPQWWIAMLGLIRLGAVPVPCTPLLTARDLEFRIKAAGISAAITDVAGSAKLDGFNGVRILVGGGKAHWISFDGCMPEMSADFEPERTRSDDPGILYFTSATTGHPKMVLHTQASYGLAHRTTGKLWLDAGPDDLHWNISDVGWGKAAWSSFYAPWHMGACVFAMDTARFDAARTLQTLEHYPITTWCAPPTALRLVIRQDLSQYRFPHLRHCITAGEPLNPEVLSIWCEATGITLHEAYGQTETTALIGNFRSLGYAVRPGSMGRANPDFDIALLDANLHEVPHGEPGEIAVRIAPHRPVGLFLKYWQEPTMTAERFRDGWYRTGDMATQDDDGYFWFIGRRDDVIKSSGYRIGPFEVESALMEHDTVLDVGVIGKPDPERGQIVKAFVVLRDGEEATDELKAELQSHCKRVAAPYKYPREIEFIDELPKTTSGKTRHSELRMRA